VSLMPVIVTRAVVLVSATLPLVVLVALNVRTALLPVSVVPVAELVGRGLGGLAAPGPGSVVGVGGSAIEPLCLTAPGVLICEPLVMPVLTVMGSAAAPLVPVKVKVLEPVPSVTAMEFTLASETLMVLVPPPLMKPALVPVAVPKTRPPVSV